MKLIHLSFLLLAFAGCKLNTSEKSTVQSLSQDFNNLKTNYLDCQSDGKDTFECKIKSNTTLISPSFSSNIKYDLEYRTSCLTSGGAGKSRLEVQQGKHIKPVLYGKTAWTNLDSFEGSEDIILVDTNPTLTGFGRYEGDCFLYFRYKSSLSNSAMTKIRNSINEIEADQKDLELIKTQNLTISILAKNIEALNLDHLKNLFSSYKEKMVKILSTEVEQDPTIDQNKINQLNSHLDFIMTINPAVDPNSNKSEIISREVSKLISISNEILLSFSNQISREIVDLESLVNLGDGPEILKIKERINIVKANLYRK